MKKSEMFPTVDIEMRNRTFHAPKCYSKYLEAMYGNYMEYPPEKDRIGHIYRAAIHYNTEENKKT